MRVKRHFALFTFIIYSLFSLLLLPPKASYGEDSIQALLTSGNGDCIDYADYLHIITGVDGIGEARDVVISGNYAYVSANGLFVFDISTPTSPLQVGTNPYGGYEMVISDNYLYSAAWSYLRVFDISIPVSPVLIESVYVPIAVGVAVEGNYAYVASNSNGFYIIDVSDPASSTIIGSVDPSYPVQCHAVAISGDYAYVATNYDAGLQVIDISQPDSPSVAGLVIVDGQAQDVFVSEPYCYLSCGNSFTVIDISSPTSPSILGTVDFPDPLGLWGGPRDMTILGNYAYVTGTTKLYAVNFSTPTSPEIAGFANTPTTTMSVDISGGYAFVANQEAGLQVMGLVLDSPIVGSVNTVEKPCQVSTSDSHAYIASNSDCLEIIDISTPTTPTLTGLVESSGYFYDVAVSGGYLYAIYGPERIPVSDKRRPRKQLSSSFPDFRSYRLIVFDVSSPESPSMVRMINSPGRAFSVTVSGNYAYVTDEAAGLKVINITIPSEATTEGFVSIPDSARGVAVFGDYACVAALTSGLHVVDISLKDSPVIVGSTDTPGESQDVAIENNYAYVADGTEGLQVIDISMPTTPVIVGTIDTPENAQHISVMNGYAYVTVGRSGLQVIDISTPTTPTLVGFYDTPGNFQGIVVRDDYIYVANRSGSLQVLKHQCPQVSNGSYEPPSTSQLLNFPNPFNPTTTIKYSIQEPTRVTLKIYSITGQLIRTLIDEIQHPLAGGYKINWDGRNDTGNSVASGVYFYRLVTKNFTDTRKMVLLR